jgi:maltose alpha-D-glucosyltransferase/alpha-amylase
MIEPTSTARAVGGALAGAVTRHADELWTGHARTANQLVERILQDPMTKLDADARQAVRLIGEKAGDSPTMVELGSHVEPTWERELWGILGAADTPAAPAGAARAGATSVDALPPGITRDATGILRDVDGRISNGMPRDPLWYQKAKFYQVDVRAFRDSTGSGHGDFRGLADSIDHIDELGMDAIWNKPHYPRGGKDDGYDIVDYFAIDPAHGTMDDFDAYVAAAHGRGKRVVTELVLNHTSDKHAWFQDELRALAKMTPAERIAAAESNSTKYVWNFSNTKAQGPPSLYDETRVIFQDFEPSNWSWSDEAEGWYWHRFFAEQPDLNWDNPDVVKDMYKVVDFWLDRGVDGVRLDAVPYLYERVGKFADGTPFQGENLKETHDAIKALRAHVDANYADRMILGEANMPAKETLEYFGNGDEANTLFNFPLMPRLYMGTWFGDKKHVVEGLQLTADIPEGTQWLTFLRNHDELTLEKVTTEQREQIWKMFREGLPAQGIQADERAPINLGVRLRMREALGHDDDLALKHARMEMMNSMLYSQPGSPIMYYGDEIGMGTNRMLNDRDGVRTFMQWDDTVNGGFSAAHPGQVVPPAIDDARIGAQAVNVAAQRADPESFFNRTKRMLAARDESPALQQGKLDIVETGDDGVVAYRRSHDGEDVVAVANLTQDARTSTIDLSRFEGRRMVPLHGSQAFDGAADVPTELALEPYGYRWFRLEP